MDNKKIILASASPRRREIFQLLGLDFEVITSSAEPENDEHAEPESFALLSAAAKAKDVCSKNPGRTVVAADTVVAVENTLLGKPVDESDASRMLSLLSGRTHCVYSAVCVIQDGKETSFCEVSEVTFYPLTDEEISAYIQTGEPMDKAGAYAVQGKGLRFIEKINGDFYNIMGFPAASFYRRFKELFQEVR